MADETTRVSRSELYGRVWSEPASKVAKGFGLSGVGFAKLCRRHEIPLPPRSYWRRRMTGHKVTQLPLPPPSSARFDTVNLPAPRAVTASPEPSPIEPEVVRERLPENQIVVPDEVEICHRFLKGVRTTLREAKPDDFGRVHALAGVVHIRVSRGEIHRALRVAQVLLAALDARGLLVTGDPPDSARLIVNEEAFGLEIEETPKRVPHEPTAAERLQIARGYPYGIPKHDYIASGILRMSIAYDAPLGVRRQWTDRAGHRIERDLNALMIGLFRCATAAKRYREEQEQRRREWEEQRRQWQEQQRLQQEEEARVKDLENRLSAWHHAWQIRAYADAVEAEVARTGAKREAAAAVKRWLKWARTHAGQYDPIAHLPTWPAPTDIPDEDESEWEG